MDTPIKQEPPMVVNPRPAGTIVIQPGDDEAAAWERLRQENASKQSAPPAPEAVKPTAQEEE